MSTAPRARRRGQSGLTLVETILTVGLATLMVVPMLGWAQVALDQQEATIERSTRSATLGTLRTRVLDDVTAADAAAVGGAVQDCAGGAGAGGRTVLGLGRGDERVVYALATADGSPALWRRSCATPGGAVTTATVVLADADPSRVAARCIAGCRRVDLVAATLGGASATISASLRTTRTDGEPTVVVTATPTSGTRPLVVELTSEGSTVPGDGPAAYRWDLGDGTTSEEPSLRHRYERPGRYTATLTITTGAGASSSAEVGIVVEDTPPVAVISEPGTDVLTFRGEPVRFSAVGSNDDADADVGGRVVSYRWDLGDGRVSTERDPVASYGSLSPPGGYVVTLTVTDDAGSTATATRRVAVLNREPTAVVVATPTEGATPLTVQLSALVGDETSMEANPPLRYLWDLGNGAVSTAPVPPPVTYTGAGPRTVTLAVTDDAGATATASTVVQVTDAGLAPPERFRKVRAGNDRGRRYIEFGWRRVEGARFYQIDLACDGCDETATAFEAGTRHRINGLGPGRRWYLARIRTQDAAGTWGPWSEPIRVRS